MNRSRLRALLLTTSLLCAGPAFAQVAFVQGGFAVDLRRFSGQPEDRVFDGNVASMMLGGGGFLTKQTSASLELDLGASRRWHKA